MKVYNKFVESKKEPYNKNDIWFDGKVFKVYKEGEWQAFTLELEAADKIYEVIKDISNVYQEKLTAGDGISIKNNTISLETFYQVVDSLPKTGKTNTIYLVTSKDAELNNKLVEYIWINNTWEKLGEHKTEIKIPTPDWNAAYGEAGYIKNRTHYAEITLLVEQCGVGSVMDDYENLPISFRFSDGYREENPESWPFVNLRIVDDTNNEEFDFRINIENKGQQDFDFGFIYVHEYDGGGIPISIAYSMYNPVDLYEIKYNTINVNYLPETVVKTTPQTLSTNEKNQAKENLDLVDVARQKDVDKLNEETTALWKDLKEGYHPNSTVGFADDLVGRGESVPAEFSFRASGGKSIKDGAARIKRLKGNSVVWNNKRNIITSLDNYGYACYNNGNKVVLKNVSASTPDFGNMGIIDGFLPIAGHKYALLTDSTLNLSISSTNGFVLAANSIGSAPSLNYTMMCVRTEIAPSIAVGASVEFNLVIVDLTLMFGAGDEPTTIEEYNARKPIVADEYAYNEGEVIPFTAEGIKSIGDNAWNGEWEQGDVSGSNGVEMDSTATWRNKGYIRIIPNEYYYIQSDSKSFLRARFYDADKNFIGIVSANNTDIYTNEAFKPASNAHYMRFAPNKSVIAEGTMMCVSLVHSGYKEGKYFPYEQDIHKIDSRILEAFPNGMVPWDKVYNKSGKGYIVKGTGVVDMGQTNISYSPTSGLFFLELTGMMLPSTYEERMSGVLCSRYAISNDAATAHMPDKSILRFPDGNIYIKDSSYTDAATFKAAMAGIILYYELAEPTIIEYDEPFNLDYLVWDFGTEEIIADKPSAPLKADIIYQFNAVDMIREHELEITELQKKINEGNNNSSNVTPDWNAQEGEAGYIENRTHFIKYTPIPKNTSVVIDALLNFDGDIPHLIKDIVIECRYSDDTIYNKQIIPAGTDVNGEVTAIPEGSFQAVTFSLNYDYGDTTIEIIDDCGYEEFRVLIYNELDDKYLPDTVLKTTPQTLSDADKNQALTNLGIDPVVWKYMCEPLVIEAGKSVPEELIGEFNEEEGDRYNLKYPYKNMYVVNVRGCRINPVGANNIGIIAEGYFGSSLEDIDCAWGSAWIDENKKWQLDA